MSFTDDEGLEYITEGSENAHETHNENMEIIDAGREYKSTLGEGANKAQVCYYDFVTGKAKLAKANDELTSHAIGLLTQNGILNDERRFRYVGKIEKIGWGLTPYKIYYLSPSSYGDITDTKPSTPDKVIEMGFTGASTEILYIQIKERLYEENLGNPASDGLFLKSTMAGVRSWSVAGSGSLFAYKTADEVSTNTTTLHDDNHLSIEVVSGITYHLTCVLQIGTPTMVGFKHRFVAPSTSDGYRSVKIFDGISGCPEGVVGGFFGILTIAYGANFAGVDTVTIVMDGFLKTTAGGTFKLQWAQNVANEDETRLYEGSFLALTAI